MQPNSVYVRVLQISIVHADCGSKSLCQDFVFARAAIVSVGKIFRYFATIMDRNRDSNHQAQYEDNFPTFSLRLECLNAAEKEKNNGKGDSASALSQFASLFEGEMQQILTERHSGKTKEMTNWSV